MTGEYFGALFQYVGKDGDVQDLQDVIGRLKAKGVETAEVTLHVGAGTFQPVRVDKIEEHKMHSEWFDVPAETVAAVEAAKARGNKVWAVGTTSMRALESAARETGRLKAGRGDTDIFITPGYRFNVADRLITNFHLPNQPADARQRVFGHGTHPRGVPPCGRT